MTAPQSFIEEKRAEFARWLAGIVEARFAVADPNECLGCDGQGKVAEDIVCICCGGTGRIE